MERSHKMKLLIKKCLVILLGFSLFLPIVEAKGKGAVIAKAISNAKSNQSVKGKTPKNREISEAVKSTKSKVSKIINPITSKGKANSASQPKLKAQLLAQQIAGGHAFDKHVNPRSSKNENRKNEFKKFGIKNRKGFQKHIEKILLKPNKVKRLTNGKTAYWGNKTGTVVIHNPKAKDGGTAFRPKEGQKYIDMDFH